ncbi:MAG: VWA domain-containing protein [Nannocystaceae bacterium]
MTRHRSASLLTLTLALGHVGCGDDGSRDTAAMTGATGVTGVTGASVTVTTGTSVTTASGSDSDGNTDSDGSSGGSASATSGSTGSSTTNTSNSSSSSTTGPGDDCSEDAECPPGQHCGQLSGKCLGADQCVYSEDCDEGKTCEAGMCVIGGDCGGDSFELTKLPPNMMIVLDRSGSMDGDVQNSNKSRWEVAKDAIFTLTTQFNDDIRFGLVTYSACELLKKCTAGKVVVPILDKAASIIMDFLASKGLSYLCNSGMSETSTGNTLQALVGNPTLQDPMRGNAILLITDGNENDDCKDNTDGAKAASALFQQPIPVKTYAVGFSDGIIGSLANIATNGGTDQPYNANDPQSLQEALNAIAANAASCDFVLNTVPDDPSKIHVFFNDNPAEIPNDPNNGWTYDPNTNTIHFHGDACKALQDGVVIDIDVVFGCNAPIPG